MNGGRPSTLALVNALAAGAILAIISDTLIPEAFEKAALYSGLIATLGFLAALTLHQAAQNILASGPAATRRSLTPLQPPRATVITPRQPPYRGTGVCW